MIINPYAFGGGGGGTPTVVLLHFDGTDGSTSIVDETGKTWTASGTAQLDTAWSKFGPSSLLLPTGTGNYIECTHADLAFGTADFCIELWLRFSNLGNVTLMDNRFGGEGAASQVIYDSDGSAIVLLTGYAAGANRFNTSSLSTSTTYHLAWCRASGVSRYFLDGTQQGSNYTDSNNYTSTKLRFGQNSTNNAAGFDGWIDELRILNGAGAGIYTSNFTPPSSPFTL